MLPPPACVMVVLLHFRVGFNLYCSPETGVTKMTRVLSIFGFVREFWIGPTVNTTQISMGSGLRPWVLATPPICTKRGLGFRV